MTRIPYIAYFTFGALTMAPFGLAQNQPAPAPDQPSVQQPNNNSNRGWRRVDEPAPADTAADPQDSQGTPAPPPPPPPRNNRPYYSGQPAPPPAYDDSQAPPPSSSRQWPQQQPPQGHYAPPPPVASGPIPSSLTIKPGTYITVRVNQPLSSDHNHTGDAFAATLVRPIVVDGVVVAERGQTIGGRVGEAKRAGMGGGTSRLGLQLTDLTFVDGQNVPITTQLIGRDGPSRAGRDVGTVAGTTALGAAAGAAADWGRGAAIGAGAGAFAGMLGILLTRGAPTVIYPEQTLTFRMENAVTISTDHAPQAFRYVQPGDYQQNEVHGRQGPPMRAAGPPLPAYYPVPYYAYPYPYYWGPTIGFYYGRGYYPHWR